MADWITFDPGRAIVERDFSRCIDVCHEADCQSATNPDQMVWLTPNNLPAMGTTMTGKPVQTPVF
jgi:hypothetical protein